MYIAKDNVNKILDKITTAEYSVYVDMKFFLKDICNPYILNGLKYMDELEMHKYFVNLHGVLKNMFKTQHVHFVYSRNKIRLDNIPGYKQEYYSKYFDDEEREPVLRTIKKVYDTLNNSSILSNDERFMDSSSSLYQSDDEFRLIKRHHGDNHAIVITRDKIFEGYDDMIVANPNELSKDSFSIREVPEYYKLILSISGYDEYSIPGVPRVKEKTAEKIINKIIDSKEYIYYNKSSKRQLLFPITYETLARFSKITREDYSVIVSNWVYLN